MRASTGSGANLAALIVGAIVYRVVVQSGLADDPPVGWEYSLEQWCRLLSLLVAAVASVLPTVYLVAWTWKQCLVWLGFSNEELKRFPYPLRSTRE